MGGFPSFVILVLAVLLFVPFWRILPRYGLSPYLAIAAIIPACALILLWIIAFSEPKDRRE